MKPHNPGNSNGNLDNYELFKEALRELGISKLLNECNIRKKSCEDENSTLSSYSVFQFLLFLVFQGRNLFQFLNGKKGATGCSKNTYYRFLNNCHYNWIKFINLLGAKVVSKINVLTRPERVNCVVLDDSTMERSRSKEVELLSRVFDHNKNKCVKGFKLQLLTWTDGFSTIPVNFRMKAASTPKNVLKGISDDIDKRTVGYKARVGATLPGPETAIEMLKQSLDQGVEASYLLADSWFTNEGFMHDVLEKTGLYYIGMHKRHLNESFYYNGTTHTMQYLADLVIRRNSTKIMGSIIVQTKKFRMPLKLVFVRNRANKSDYIVIVCNDCTISDEEIVRLYGNRWNIEVCFKACKSLLNLGHEFQGLSYDMTMSSTAIALTRYIFLEWTRRKNTDDKTMCELFFVLCDDVADMELTTALKSLVTLFVDGIQKGHIVIDNTIKQQLINWYMSQPEFIKILFPKFLESIKIDNKYEEEISALIG